MEISLNEIRKYLWDYAYVEQDLRKYLSPTGDQEIEVAIHNVLFTIGFEVERGHVKEQQNTFHCYNRVVFNTLVDFKVPINRILRKKVPGYMVYSFHCIEGAYKRMDSWERYPDTYSVYWGPVLELLSLVEGS